MKILFDVGVPHQLRRIIMKQGYSVETSQYHGWTLRDNGDLLDLAEQNGFQILITTDQSMEHELNLAKWDGGWIADPDWWGNSGYISFKSLDEALEQCDRWKDGVYRGGAGRRTVIAVRYGSCGTLT